MKIVPFDEALSPNEEGQLFLFNRVFKEFWCNFEDLRNEGLCLSGGFSLRENGVVHGGELGVSRHRLKGFFLDYRLFHQQTEPVYFFRICNLLGRRCRSPDFLFELEKNKTTWLSPEVPLVGWHNEFSVTDVVEAHFNEKLFHTKEAKKTSFHLDEIRQKLSDDALMYATVSIVTARLMVLRNVNWMIAPLFAGQQSVRLPNL